MAEHDETDPRYQHGMEELRKHLGPMADSYIQTIKEVSPEFAWVNVEFPYGELYSRSVVDAKTRELCYSGSPDGHGFRPASAQSPHRRRSALRRQPGRSDGDHHADDRLLRLSRSDERADGSERRICR